MNGLIYRSKGGGIYLSAIGFGRGFEDWVKETDGDE
jgi:hypothetical protein